MSVKSILLFIAVIGLGIGSILLWIWFLQPAPGSTTPSEPATRWHVLEDFTDGYSVEYPAGTDWHPLSYTNVGTTHSLRIAGKQDNLAYFTLFIHITADEDAAFAETTAELTKSLGEPRTVSFEGKDTLEFSTPQETSYVFTHRDALWVVHRPRFANSEKQETTARIFESLTILNDEKIARRIVARDGNGEQATEEQIARMKERDSTRKANLAAYQSILEDYFEGHGQYPISLTEDRIYKGRESLSTLQQALMDESEVYLYYSQIPGDPKESFFYTYQSDGTSYVLTARLEQGQEHECDRSIPQDICIYAVRP